MKRILPALLLAPCVSLASLYSHDGVESLATDGTGDIIITFTNFNASQSLNIYQSLAVRALLVGGGGGGGAECGGGGGGGGMIDTNDFVLAAGDYTVTVGRRGEGGNTSANGGRKQGGNGGNTSLALGGMTVLEAIGGGGGGVWNSGAGSAGGSGGGGANTGGKGGAGTDGQGLAGGDNGGGGGGAGGPGGVGAGARNAGAYGVGAQNGAGGVGRMSDITSALVYYAGGGGGGGYNDNPGPGGLGGGGNGMRNGDEATRKARSQAEFDAEAGVDGLGGGGGGGNNTSYYYGRPGGSGIMVIRIPTTSISSSVPRIAFDGQTATNRHDVSLLAHLHSPGDGHEGETVSLSLEYATSRVALLQGDSATNLLSSAFSGTLAFEVPGLESETTYHGRLVAVNDGGDVGYSAAFTFSTMTIHGPRHSAGDGSTAIKSGLWQCKVSGVGTASFNTEIDGGTTGAVVVPGTVMAAVTSRSNTSSYWEGDGMSYTDAAGTNWTFNSGYSYIYSGYAFLQAGVTYRFFERMMDNCRFVIDDEEIINDTRVAYNTVTYGSYTCLTSDWHHVQVWLGGSDAGAGNSDQWAFSFGYNANDVLTTTGSPGKEWSMFLDPGDGSFLRAELSARLVDVKGYAMDVANDSASFDVEFGKSTAAIGETGLFVAYGLDDGGTISNFWANIERVGDLPVSMEHQTLTATVAGLSGMRYVCFFAVGEDGSVGWSEVVDLGETDISKPLLSPVTIEHDGDTATATFSIFGLGAGNVRTTLYVAQSADFAGATSISLGEATTAGPHSATFSVAPGVANYVKVVVTDENGGTAVAESGGFTTLAGSRLDDTKRTSSVRHRTATCSGVFDQLGAGTTTVTLYTGPSSAALAQDGEPITLSERDFSFTRTYNETPTAKHYYKFVAVNTAPGGSCWTNESRVGEFTTLDQASYRWKASVADGYWDDASCWDAVTYADYCTGFPRQGHPDGGDILFTNGLHATIRVSGAQVGSRMKLGGTGMDILFLGEGSGASIKVDMQGRDAPLSRSKLTFSNLSIIELDNFDEGLCASSDTNVVVRFTNGARLSRSGDQMLSGEFNFKAADSAIVIDGGASVLTESLRLNGRGASLLVDGGTLSANGAKGVSFNASGEDNTVSFVVGGDGGRLVCLRGVFSNISGKAVENDVSLAFDLPVSGWAAAPLYSAYETGTFADFSGEGNTGKMVVSLDRESAALRATSRLSTQAVAWRGGIATNNVKFAESKRATWTWTYGWPSNLAQPENEGDLPTGLRLDLASGGATYLLLR